MTGSPSRLSKLLMILAVVGASAVVFLPGLSSTGLWDPWEMNETHMAAQMANGTKVLVASPILKDPTFPYLDALGKALPDGFVLEGITKKVGSALSSADQKLTKSIYHVLVVDADAELTGKGASIDKLVTRLQSILTKNTGLQVIVHTKANAQPLAAALDGLDVEVVVDKDAVDNLAGALAEYKGLAWQRSQFKRSGTTYSVPPLDTWTIALSYDMFGFDELSSRLPSLMWAIFGVIIVFWIVRRSFGLTEATLAALVMISMPLYGAMGRFAVSEISYTVTLLLSVGMLLLIEREGLKPGYIAFLIVGLVLGFLSKGLTFLLIVTVIQVMYMLLARRFAKEPLVTTAIVAVAFGIGLALVFVPDSFSFFDHFKFMNKLFTDSVKGWDRNFDYFVNKVGFGTYPWIAVLPFALGALVFGKWGDGDAAVIDEPGRRTRLMVLTWFVVPLVLLSMMLQDFEHFVFPGLPAGAIAVGVFLTSLIRAKRPVTSTLVGILGFGIIGVIIHDLKGSPHAMFNMFLFDPPFVKEHGEPKFPEVVQYSRALLLVGLLLALTIMNYFASLGTHVRKIAEYLRRPGAFVVSLWGAGAVFAIALLAPVLWRVGTALGSGSKAVTPADKLIFSEVLVQTPGFVALAVVAGVFFLLYFIRLNRLGTKLTFLRARWERPWLSDEGSLRVILAYVGVLGGSLLYLVTALVAAPSAGEVLASRPVIWLLGALGAGLFLVGLLGIFGKLPEGSLFAPLRPLAKGKPRLYLMCFSLAAAALFMGVVVDGSAPGGTIPMWIGALIAGVSFALLFGFRLVRVRWAHVSVMAIATLGTFVLVFGRLLLFWLDLKVRLQPGDTDDYLYGLVFGPLAFVPLTLVVGLVVNYLYGVRDGVFETLSARRRVVELLVLLALALVAALVVGFGSKPPVAHTARALGLLTAVGMIALGVVVVALTLRTKSARILERLRGHLVAGILGAVLLGGAGAFILVHGQGMASVTHPVALGLLGLFAAVALNYTWRFFNPATILEQLQKPLVFVVVFVVTAVGLTVGFSTSLVSKVTYHVSQKHIIDTYKKAEGVSKVGGNLFKYGKFSTAEVDDSNFYTASIPEITSRETMIEVLLAKEDSAFSVKGGLGEAATSYSYLEGWNPANDLDGNGVRDWASDGGIASSLEGGTLVDDSKEWTVDQWKGFNLFDKTGKSFPILGNQATSLLIGGTPSITLANPLMAAYTIDSPQGVDHKATAMGPIRTYFILPKKSFSEINHAFRKKSGGQHITVLDDRSDFFILATSWLAKGETEHNWIANSIITQEEYDAIETIHPSWVNYDDKMELLGWDMDSETVGRGKDFTIRMYFKVKAEIPVNYKIFMHIDRPQTSNRINGDHWPLNLTGDKEEDEKCEGCFKTTQWMPGDIYVDTFTREVPLGTPSGPQEIWMGLFNTGSSKRFKVIDWDKKTVQHDGKDRVKIGTFQVP